MSTTGDNERKKKETLYQRKVQFMITLGSAPEAPLQSAPESGERNVALGGDDDSSSEIPPVPTRQEADGEETQPNSQTADVASGQVGEDHFQHVEERARSRTRRRTRSNEICVTFTLIAVIVVIAVPLVLTRKRSILAKPRMSIEVIYENLIDIACDSGHTCAIRAEDHSILCWGNQLGVPANLFQVSAIAVGDGYSCAIKEPDSTLMCWGEDSHADFVQPPLDLGPVSFLSASGGMVCVVESLTGSGRCWGISDFGRVELAMPESIGRLRAVAAPKKDNWRRLCGVREEDDAVHCWSISVELLMIDENAIDWEEKNGEVVGPVDSLAVMEDFACAIFKPRGNLHCWAFDDTLFNVNLPAIPNGTTYARIVPGNSNEFCAIQKGGKPLCFGFDGQPKSIPGEVGNVNQIAVNQGNVCAVRKELGQGVCWGVDAAPGQLSPLEHDPTFAAEVAAGERRTCSIHLYRDMVDCWGSKRYQLLVDAFAVAVGDDVTCVVDSSDYFAKCVVGDGTFILQRRVKQIHVSPNDTICTVGLDGIVECYRARCEQTRTQQYYICDGYTNFTGNPASLFGPVETLKTSRRHFCAVQMDSRRLKCGALPNTNTNQTETTPEADVPIDLLEVQDFALGLFFSCAIQVNYEIVCWGDETKYASEYILTPPQGNYYTAIAATRYEACAITLDRFVHCWGRPFISSIYVPSTVRDVVQLTAGSDHFCVLMENKEVECWGSNRYGELSRDYFG